MRVVDPAVAPRIAAEQAPAGLRPTLDEAVLAERVERVLGAARVVLAVRPEQRPNVCGQAWTSTMPTTRLMPPCPCRRPRHALARATSMPAALGGLDQARAARRARSRARPGSRPASSAERLAQPALDPVPRRPRRRPAFGTARPSRGSPSRLLAREPVEDEEARRDASGPAGRRRRSPASGRGGADVARRRLPALRRRGACGPWRGGA